MDRASTTELRADASGQNILNRHRHLVADDIVDLCLNGGVTFDNRAFQLWVAGDQIQHVDCPGRKPPRDRCLACCGRRDNKIPEIALGDDASLRSLPGRGVAAYMDRRENEEEASRKAAKE